MLLQLPVLLFVFVSVKVDGQILPVEVVCRSWTCENNGTSVITLASCYCICQHGYTGIRCTTVRMASDWPVGPYVLPMSIYGCPEAEDHGWSSGYLNMTFTHNLTTFALNKGLSHSDRKQLHLVGPYSDYVIQMNFCYKHSYPTTVADVEVQWPEGEFVIYRANGTCPDAFKETVLLLELPPLLGHTLSDFLPDFTTDITDHATVVSFNTCDKIHSHTEYREDLPATNWTFPVIFMSSTTMDTNNCCNTTGSGNCTEETLIPGPFKYCVYIPNAEPTITDSLPSLNLELKCATERIPELEKVYLLSGSYAISLRRSLHQRILADVWLLIDVEAIVFFESLYFTVPSVTEYDVSDEVLPEVENEIPAIRISSQKWDFLSNGALSPFSKCAFHWGDTEYKFACESFRPIRGRYVVFIADANRASSQKRFLYFLITCWDISLKIRASEQFLGMDLGITDHVISDYQISASSFKPDFAPHHARLSQQGWCPLDRDSDMFLQIDLLEITMVIGVRLYSWAAPVNKTINNVFTSVNQRQSLTDFTIEYGFNVSSLFEYRSSAGITNFVIDRSVPFPGEQVFVFGSHIVLSVMRIYPKRFLDKAEQACLKCEILGYSLMYLKTLDCSDQTTQFWASQEGVYVSPQSLYQPREVTNVTLTDCKRFCDTNGTACVAIRYSGELNVCSLYDKSDNMNYVLLEEKQNTTTYQRTCLAESDFKSFTANIGHINVDTQPRPVTHFGYPLYQAGVESFFSYRITAKEGMYLRLLFTNISVTEHKDNSFFATFGSSTRNVMGLDFTRTHQFVYPLLESEVRITHGPWRSFRALAVASNLPWFTSGILDGLQLPSVPGNVGFLISNSYLGLSYADDRRIEFWRILGHNRYIEMTILEMDVSCDGDSLLQVLHAKDALSKICNHQRPIGSIRSSSVELVVRFRNSLEVGLREGFVAEYRKLTHSYNMIRNTSSSQACVEEFGKCYIIHNDKDMRRLTHIDAEERCRQKQEALVTLGSKEEEHFLKYLVREKIRSFIKRPFLPTSIQSCRSWQWLVSLWTARGSFAKNLGHNYFGLKISQEYPYIKKSDDALARWASGKPLTYTAWREGQPVGHHCCQTYCVQMGIHGFSFQNSWETIPCNSWSENPYNIHSFYICEKAMHEKKVENLHDQLDNFGNDTIKSPSYRHWPCGSGEYVSRLFVCDGTYDCLDRSDEQDCKLEDQDTDICPAGYFRCNDGGCVSLSVCCDLVPDCQDASDEYCDYSSDGCLGNQFRCDNGQCIGPHLKCNSIEDCIDGTDEQTCDQCAYGFISCQFKGSTSQACLNPMFVCDGIVHCIDVQDEEGCPTCLGSCRDWWLRGHRTSGEYCIDTHRVECNFDTAGLIKTIYYDTGTEVDTSYAIKITYGSLAVVKKLYQEQKCSMLMSMSCKPPTSTFAKYDGIGENRGYWGCFCVRWRFGQDPYNWTLEACSEETQNEVASRGEAWLEEIALGISYVSPLPVAYIAFNASFPTKPSIESIICEEDDGTMPDVILCAQGNTVPGEQRCLYQEEGGFIKGCSDLSHLRDCATFDCPHGYVKCPHSFCIPISYLCDGKYQCPDANDEIDCWCGATQLKVAIVVGYTNSGDPDTLVQMVKQLSDSTDITSELMIIRLIMTRGYGNSDSDLYGSVEKLYLNDMNEHVSSNEEFNDTDTLMTSCLNYFKDEQSVLMFYVDKTIYGTKQAVELFDFSLFENLKVMITVAGEDADHPLNEIMSSRIIPSDASIIYLKDVQSPKLFAQMDFTLLCPAPKVPVCPGLYRCHSSRQCLLTSSLCDGIPDCPQGDDERLCDFVCPKPCECDGFIADCSGNRANISTLASLSRTTRALTVHDNNLCELIKYINYTDYTFTLPLMVYLNMSLSNLTGIPIVLLEQMQEILSLDLSYNRISAVRRGDFRNNPKLKLLLLDGNTFLHTIETLAFENLPSIRNLAIHQIGLSRLHEQTFSGLNLTSLDLSLNRLSVIDDYAFDGLSVENLTLSQNNIQTFSDEMFQGVVYLKYLNTDSYRFCCIRPNDVDEANCKPYKDAFSSCSDLMRNEALRFLLWIVGLCALIGNALSLIYRLKFDRKRLKLGYGVFVTHLAVADLLMGVYLLTIAIVDLIYRGGYIYVDEWWRSSHWCTLTGVISTISSEASVLFLCFITIDRLLVIKYPFGEIRFNTKTATVVAFCVWGIATIIALVPVVWTSYFKNEFYSKTGVCLALPLTTDTTDSVGSVYSIAIFIGLNFATFVLLGFGQLLIYKHVRASSLRVKRTSSRVNDLKVARNLLLVVSTDFLCWFPIGIMGILALGGVEIPGVVYAWTAVLILPVNSALNPFLYTFSAIVGKKNFTPDIEEQSRMTLFTSGYTVKLLNVWTLPWVLQKTPLTGEVIPLTDYLQQTPVTPIEILKISFSIVRTLRRLHCLHLVSNEMTVNDVFVKVDNDKISSVNLKMAPTFGTTLKEKSADIECLGKIIKELMHVVESNHRLS